MSEPEGDRDWRPYVQDMVEFGERVVAYVEGLDREAFTADQRTYDATLRNIELLGEAATHVPEHVREAHPEIAWRQIIGIHHAAMLLPPLLTYSRRRQSNRTLRLSGE